MDKLFQTIGNIVASTKVSPKTMVLELFDQIFQKNHARQTRKALFLEAVRLFEIWNLKGEFQNHLFTGMLDDKLKIQIDPKLVHNFVERLRAIKAWFPDQPQGAAAAVFALIEEQDEQKFNFFLIVFICGYFPYNSDCWILFPYEEPKTPDEATAAANEQMFRTCWALQDNEQLLPNYTVNLIRSLNHNPAAQKAVIVQLMAFVKNQGQLEIEAAEPIRYEISGPTPWIELLANQAKVGPN